MIQFIHKYLVVDHVKCSSVHGKVFEYILLKKTTIAKDGQSNMQFGFTEGLSPNMAALILSEVWCIFRQALLYLESNDAVESAELVVGDYSEVDWKLVDKIFVELESDFWRWYIWKRTHRRLHMLDRRVKRKIVQIPQSKTRDWKSKIREERIMT
jgi:hypothetical protein